MNENDKIIETKLDEAVVEEEVQKEEASEKETEQEVEIIPQEQEVLLEEQKESIQEESIEEVEELEEFSNEELELDEENLEAQIESAVLELSDDDLATELDAETLLDIAVNDIDGLDAINANDIKLAIGEEVKIEKLDEEETNNEEFELDEELTELDENSSNEGVESLKTLLKALTNENVSASLKGMKISINITLGDK